MEENRKDMENGPITHPLSSRSRKFSWTIKESFIRKRKLVDLNPEAFGLLHGIEIQNYSRDKLKIESRGTK